MKMILLSFVSATVLASWTCAHVHDYLSDYRILTDHLSTTKRVEHASPVPVSTSSSILQPPETFAQAYMNKVCSNQPSCHLVGSNVSDVQQTLLVRNCMCDADCNTYGDCCLDSRFYVAADQTTNYQRFRCSEQKFYLKASCAAQYANREVISKCADGADGRENGSRVLGTPITEMDADGRANVTYANVYCAICDNRDPMNGSSRFRLWRVTYSCDADPDPTDASSTRTTVAGSSGRAGRGPVAAAANVSWDGWLRQYRGHDGDVAYKCRPLRQPPDDIVAHLRRCAPAISGCPADAHPRLAAKCASFSLLVHDVAVSYRNAFCAECNRVPQWLDGCRPQAVVDNRFSSQRLFSSADKAAGSSACSDPNANADLKRRFCP